MTDRERHAGVEASDGVEALEGVDTLLGLLDRAVDRHGDRPFLGIRRDDGTTTTWTFRELRHRSRIAAWRLRSLGLQPGDRILTWSPSTPELPAVYFGAMRAGLILVPLDLRMSSDAIEGIVRKSGARHLVLGTGRDAPDPREAGLGHFPTTTVDAIAAEPPDWRQAPPDAADRHTAFPADWEAQLDAWDPIPPETVFQLVFTSGTTGSPKGVMLAHDNVIASIRSFHRIIPPLEHRIISLGTLAHLLEQAVGLYYAMSVGAHTVYVRSRHPRVIFEALAEHHVTSMVVVPQVLDLFWSGLEREVERAGRGTTFARLRRIARRLPFGLRRLLFRRVHAQLGGGLRLFVSAGAFLPPALQGAWEDLGVIVLQGYGLTETGTGTCTTLEDHGLGTVGRPVPGIEMRIADDGEVQFRGPTLFKGYWEDPERTADAYTDDGWFRTGDIGHLDPEGRLVLSGRARDRIALPNGFNVYPEDVENALRVAGIRDSVVLETRPGRLEAVVLAPGAHPLARGDDRPIDLAGRGAVDPRDGEDRGAAVRAAIDAAIRAANGRLGLNQRVAGWRLWPDADFPRTHTFKVRREVVRAWVEADRRADEPAPAEADASLARH